MRLEILLANCINSESLNKEDIQGICYLLKSKSISINDVVFSLESELVSPIANQKKRAIEIIDQLLLSYLPDEGFTSAHIKLISCFVLNYSHDWACIDSVIGIIRCIFETQSPKTLKDIKIDMRDDNNIFEEYLFNPVILMQNETADEIIDDAGKDPDKVDVAVKDEGNPESKRKYSESHFEICSYHKFNNLFGIKDAESDDDLYKMNLPFYLITQILYKVATRQFVYGSRIIIVDLLLFIFKSDCFDDELFRLGPGAVPILIQHIENEKDPRVLIKAFPLMELMIRKFANIITQYDQSNTKKKNKNESGFDQEIEYSSYQIYHGRIPKLSKEEEENLIKKYQSLAEEDSSSKKQVSENTCESQLLSENSEILSSLISETLFAYFPLQLNSSNINNRNQKGRIPKKELKNAYFSLITSSDIIQDSLFQSLAEYVDTQGLLENTIFDYAVTDLSEESVLNQDDNSTEKEATNVPINMGKMDEEILEDIISILGMIKYEIDPKIVNKYIPGVLLLLNVILKNILVATERVYDLLIAVFSVFINLEMRYEQGQNIILDAINKIVIPNIFNRLDSNNQLDKFAFNVIQIFVLTGNEFIISNIRNNFLFKEMNKNNDLERVSINLKLLITIYLSCNRPLKNAEHCEEQVNDFPNRSENSALSLTNLDEYHARAKVFSELVEKNIENFVNNTKNGTNTHNNSLFLPELCIYYIYNLETDSINTVIMQIFDIMKAFWRQYNYLSENDRYYLLGMISLSLVVENCLTRTYWLEFHKNEIQGQYDNLFLLEYALYTVIPEDNIPEDILSSFVDNVKNNIFGVMSGEKYGFTYFDYLSQKLENTVDILNSNKWKATNVSKHITFELKEWIYTIVSLINSSSQLDKSGPVPSNKAALYSTYKNLAILTIKLFDINKCDSNFNPTAINESFEIISEEIPKTKNKLFILIFINGFIDELLTFGIKFNIDSIDSIINTCIEWTNVSEHDYNDEDEANESVEDEIEKLIINSLLLGKDVKSIENSIFMKQCHKNNVIIGKISRYYLFSQEKDYEIIYKEIKESLTELTIKSLTDDKSTLMEKAGDHFEPEMFNSIKLLYIIGGNLNLLKSQSHQNISLLFGKSRFIFQVDKNTYSDIFKASNNLKIYRESYSDLYMYASKIGNYVSSILTLYSNYNNGKYLYHMLDHFINPQRDYDAVDNINDNAVNLIINDQIENHQMESLCDMWPIVIPLTDNSYPVVDLDDKLAQKKVSEINDIIADHYWSIFKNNDLVTNYKNNAILLMPLISSMNNLNTSTILKSYSSEIINSVIFLSLTECTNYLAYKPIKCENPHLMSYLINLTKDIGSSSEVGGSDTKYDQEVNTYLNSDPNLEITRLLKTKKTSNSNWTLLKRELFIFNIQSLSIIMRIIHYSRENKLIIYENRDKNKHQLDFIFENLRIYSILVLNIIENHPNSLVRFLSLLIISQIFKFPSVFRTNIKDDVLKTLTIALNNDPNRKLREMSSILKLRILTMSDHIYF